MRAYLAGLFDGEGSISNMIAVNGPREYRHRGQRWSGVVVQLSMTTPEPVKLLHAYYGGQLRPVIDKRPRCKPRMFWRTTGPGALLFLEEITPFLIVKRPHAEIAVTLLRLSGKPKKGREGSSGFRDSTVNDGEVIEEKQRLINELIVLNGSRRPPIHFQGSTLYVEQGGRAPGF